MYLSLQMVFQLYNDPNPEAKVLADQWLQGLQASEHAWTLAWPLLQHQVRHSTVRGEVERGINDVIQVP